MELFPHTFALASHFPQIRSMKKEILPSCSCRSGSGLLGRGWKGEVSAITWRRDELRENTRIVAARGIHPSVGMRADPAGSFPQKGFIVERRNSLFPGCQRRASNQNWSSLGTWEAAACLSCGSSAVLLHGLGLGNQTQKVSQKGRSTVASPPDRPGAHTPQSGPIIPPPTSSGRPQHINVEVSLPARPGRRPRPVPNPQQKKRKGKKKKTTRMKPGFR